MKGLVVSGEGRAVRLRTAQPPHSCPDPTFRSQRRPALGVQLLDLGPGQGRENSMNSSMPPLKFRTGVLFRNVAEFQLPSSASPIRRGMSNRIRRSADRLAVHVVGHTARRPGRRRRPGGPTGRTAPG